ncbi:TPA: hypothetical protein ACKRQV_000238 [Pseudomonas aeruginosa]|nr:hypothetical protein [Pseudomonas aeruginosa]EIU2862519.1 hypothetical protein [Pseudomonas aeruginosa]
MQSLNAISIALPVSAVGIQGVFFSSRPDSADGPALGAFLTYHVNIDSDGEFYADVRDAYGKTVFEVDGDPAASGLMTSGYDLKGLKRVLVENGLMQPKQLLVMG